VRRQGLLHTRRHRHHPQRNSNSGRDGDLNRMDTFGKSSRRLEVDSQSGDVVIYFVDETADAPEASIIRTEVARVISGTVSNMPYAPDENYSFDADLYESSDHLVVSITQKMESITDSSETTHRFLSKDNGSSWSKRPTDDSVDISQIRS